LATQFDKAVLRCRNDWDRHLSPSLERMGRSMDRMWEAHADMIEHRRGMEEARRVVGPVLPPRLRRTLDCLLEGEDVKGVARRLGLSRHTVHLYVTDLYKRFGVHSRAELLAVCLRKDEV
jgi:DNA-binding NarL/FixJ family response regulator